VFAPPFSGRDPALGLRFESREENGEMANREQKNNREKKKPKADKNAQMKPAKAPAYIQPELVRKPHKGKGDY
jgi:hypothetical protein